ncbi:MAG: flagellar hook-associated protein FlgL [Gammaproteobacteria bacterium]|nr:flagellar hook-associated protein FlgL [Gammaproteobacteria bacterium]
MRISTRQIQQFGIDSILGQQTKLSKTQLQVATGRRVLLPSDDPVATTQVLRLRQTVDTTSQYQANADAAANRLVTEEGVLDGVTTLLQRVRELAVQANNAVQTDETRRYLAAEVEQRLGELLGLANAKDGTGDYLFSGTKGATQPFAKTSVGYRYDGDQSQRMVQIGAGRQIPDGDQGAEVFQFVRNGNGVFVTEANPANTGTGIIDPGNVVDSFVPSLPNGYSIQFSDVGVPPVLSYEVFDSAGNPVPVLDATGTPVLGPIPYLSGEPIEFAGAKVSVAGQPVAGDEFTVKSSEYQDIFQTLENLISALHSPATDPTQRAHLGNNINRTLTDVDQAMGNILVVRSSIGARLNAIDSQKYVNDEYLLQSEQILSSIQDLDYAEAISRLHLQAAGLEASQAAYMKVNGLTMFNFMK